MPTVLRVKGFRFFFYSNEGMEPLHTHVAKGGGAAKYLAQGTGVRFDPRVFASRAM